MATLNEDDVQSSSMASTSIQSSEDVSNPLVNESRGVNREERRHTEVPTLSQSSIASDRSALATASSVSSPSSSFPTTYPIPSPVLPQNAPSAPAITQTAALPELPRSSPSPSSLTAATVTAKPINPVNNHTQPAYVIAL